MCVWMEASTERTSVKGASCSSQWEKEKMSGFPADLGAEVTWPDGATSTQACWVRTGSGSAFKTMEFGMGTGFLRPSFSSIF